MKKKNGLFMSEIENKDIFAIFQEIDKEKEMLRPHYNIDTFVTELKKNSCHKNLLQESILIILNQFCDYMDTFQSLWYESSLIEDLELHAVLSTYYTIHYLYSDIRNIDDFLRYCIPDFRDRPIQDEKKRILNDLKRNQTQCFFPLLNFTATTQKQSVSCFLPLIFNALEYDNDKSTIPSGTSAIYLRSYNHNIKLDMKNYTSSLNRKLRTTMDSIYFPYQKIFHILFDSKNNKESSKSEFLLYYYKIERGYGFDLLYALLKFIKEKYPYTKHSKPEKKHEQEIVDFMLIMQKFPNVLTRNVNFIEYYEYYKEFKRRSFLPPYLCDLCNYYQQFAKLWGLTIIEYFDRDFDAIRTFLFDQLDENIYVDNLYSTYKKKFLIQEKSPVLQSEIPSTQITANVLADDLHYSKNELDLSAFPHLPPAGWNFKAETPYNDILDSYFKIRYTDKWWDWKYTPGF